MLTKHYKSDHALEILKMLNNDRMKMKSYCDFTLTAESNDFAAHKCVLGVFSTFFSKMFSVEMKEKYERKGNLPGITKETLKTVLNFIYTCDIIITSENVYTLIEAANYLEIQHLKEFCVEFLLGDIDATNCLRIRAYSKLYDFHKLEEKADAVIANNFGSVIKEKEFNQLKFEDIKTILEIEDKQVKSEETVFHGMIQWIKYDVDLRRQHMTELFNLIKLNKLSGDFLQEVVSHEELVMSSNECTKAFFQFFLSQFKIQQNVRAMTGQKKENNHFLAFCRKQVCIYDIKKKVARSLPNTMFDHLYGSAVHHKRKVYVISGEYNKIVEMLDLDDQASGWTHLPSLEYMKRNGGASAVFNDHIYNYGGWESGRSGQCYNIEENKWTQIDNMNEGRSHFALVSNRRGIYAMGGRNSNGCLKTVEYQDPRQGGWISSLSMNVERVALSGVVLNDELYAIGGYNDESRYINSVERFDPQNQTWCCVAEMNYARFNHGACVCNGKIYVAGGGEDYVEVYDPEKNIWRVEAIIPEFKDVQFIVAI